MPFCEKEVLREILCRDVDARRKEGLCKISYPVAFLESCQLVFAEAWQLISVGV